MTLKTIAGSRDTEEFGRAEQQIAFRASGAAIFALDNEGPSTKPAPSAPSL